MPGSTASRRRPRSGPRHPAIEVVALTSFIEEDRVDAAIEAGASGFLLKDAEADELAAAIRRRRAGEVHLDPAVAGIVARRMRDRRGRRGRRAAAAADGAALGSLDGAASGTSSAGVARGLSNRAIADELGIAERTARTHVSNILAKLGLTSRTQAALFAVEHGLGPRRPSVTAATAAPAPTYDVDGPDRRAGDRLRPRHAADRARVGAQMAALSDDVPVDRPRPARARRAGRPSRSPSTAPPSRSPSDHRRARPAAARSSSACRSAATSRWTSPRVDPERVRGLVLAGATAEPVGVRALPVPRAGLGHGRVRRRARSTAVNAWFFRTRFPPAIAEPIVAGGFWSTAARTALRALVGERFVPRLAAYPGPT